MLNRYMLTIFLNPVEWMLIGPGEKRCCRHAARRQRAAIDFKQISDMKVRELIKLLQEDGWKQVRMRGSHRQFRHPSKRGIITVAGKPSVDIPPGTLTSILKHADLKQRGSS